MFGNQQHPYAQNVHTGDRLICTLWVLDVFGPSVEVLAQPLDSLSRPIEGVIEAFMCRRYWPFSPSDRGDRWLAAVAFLRLSSSSGGSSSIKLPSSSYSMAFNEPEICWALPRIDPNTHGSRHIFSASFQSVSDIRKSFRVWNIRIRCSHDGNWLNIHFIKRCNSNPFQNSLIVSTWWPSNNSKWSIEFQATVQHFVAINLGNNSVRLVNRTVYFISYFSGQGVIIEMPRDLHRHYCLFHDVVDLLAIQEGGRVATHC